MFIYYTSDYWVTSEVSAAIEIYGRMCDNHSDEVRKCFVFDENRAVR